MQNDKMQVLDMLRKTVHKYDMLSDGDTVLVGVSGGADSVCLLHCLYTLQNEFKIRLAAAHVNHGIRGEEAERDENFVRELCRKLDIPFYLKKADVPKLAEQEDISEETAGRLVRYRFFKELCAEHNIEKIATAHNRDDQAETVLMRIIRGTGIDGLSGIQYCRKDGVIRPLLDVERTQIEKYCEENKLEYCTDSTNSQNDYTRNRIRNQLLPMLRSDFNPQITEALAVLSQNMSSDGAFIRSYTERLYKRINSPAPSKKPVVLDIESLMMVDESIQIRLIRLAVSDAMGKGYHLERSHMEAVLGLLKKETGAGVSLPKGLFAVVRYGWLAFETPDDTQKYACREFSDGLHFEAEIGKTYDFDGYRVTLKLQDSGSRLLPNQMIVDYDKVSEIPLEVRNRKRGDRISVYKDGKSRKLKDYMIDAKIPVWKRGSIPLLCSGTTVIAVIGYRVAEPYKAGKETKRGLVIEYDAADVGR